MLGFRLEDVQKEEEIALLLLAVGCLLEMNQLLVQRNFGVDWLPYVDALRAGAAGFEVEEVMRFGLRFRAQNESVQVLILFHG